MRVLHFDCACGASGDMVCGALIDAGADFAKIRAALLSLGVHGFDVKAEKINKRGVVATQFSVLEHHHDHDHHHDHHAAHGHHHHPHRNLHDILHILGHGDLPAAVKEAATATFRRIAECEAAIHGTTVDEIHFHEVGAIDSIVDIVGAHLAMHLLRVDRVTATPLNVGSGTIKIAHGVLPVPAPATVILLKGAPSYGSEVQAELVTPTGAALITGFANAYGAQPALNVERVGYGSGTKDLPDRPNVLRVTIGETLEQPTGEPIGESVVVMETTIDDMNPELYPTLLAELLAKGARDAFLTPVLGKKGRPAHLLTLLCDEGRATPLAEIVFRNSTTFGVRYRTERRICLEREWKSVDTPWGAVRVKIGRYQGEVTCLAPEFEDCRQAAEAHGVSVLAVYDAARAAAAKGDPHDV